MINSYITDNKFKQANFVKANKSLSKSKKRIKSNHILGDFWFFYPQTQINLYYIKASIYQSVKTNLFKA